MARRIHKRKENKKILSPRYHGQSNFMAYLNKEQYEYRRNSAAERLHSTWVRLTRNTARYSVQPEC